MSTSRETIEYLLGQLGSLKVRSRAMFGGYCLYCDEKVVLLVNDDLTFLKSSPVTDSLGLDCEMAPPYPGAKETLLLHDRILQDPAEFQRIVQATADALPKPGPKKKKAAKQKAAKKSPKRA